MLCAPLSSAQGWIKLPCKWLHPVQTGVNIYSSTQGWLNILTEIPCCALINKIVIRYSFVAQGWILYTSSKASTANSSLLYRPTVSSVQGWLIWLALYIHIHQGRTNCTWGSLHNYQLMNLPECAHANSGQCKWRQDQFLDGVCIYTIFCRRTL